MAHHYDFSPATGFAADALARCGRVTTDLVDQLGNLGALVMIDVEGVGRATWTAGHSDLARTRAVQPDHIYAIGSQTKTVVAMTMLLMARDGLLGLDDPVHAYVDLPIDRRITVRHLLMNAGGLGEIVMALVAARADPRIRYAPRDLVALALPQGQIFAPGDRFDYCNTGWVIAAMIIEAVGGKPYGAVVADRILHPLGLVSSGFGGRAPPGDYMRCYMAVSGEPEPVDTTQAQGWAFGAGDGLCSAGDILAIYKSLLDAGSPLGISLADLGGRTLKPGSKPHFALSLGTEYGLGLERRAWAGQDVWGHPGSTFACRTSTWIDPERRVAITTAATIHLADTIDDALRYPRAQLFAMALNTAYALAAGRG